jgi:hypothetical protein
MSEETEQKIHELAKKIYEAGYKDGQLNKPNKKYTIIEQTDEEIMIGDEVYLGKLVLLKN